MFKGFFYKVIKGVIIATSVIVASVIVATSVIIDGAIIVNGVSVALVVAQYRQR